MPVSRLTLCLLHRSPTSLWLCHGKVPLKHCELSTYWKNNNCQAIFYSAKGHVVVFCKAKSDESHTWRLLVTHVTLPLSLELNRTHTWKNVFSIFVLENGPTTSCLRLFYTHFSSHFTEFLLGTGIFKKCQFCAVTHVTKLKPIKKAFEIMLSANDFACRLGNGKRSYM